MKRLIISLVILVAVGILASWFFNVPQRIGLVDSPTDKLICYTPDRDIATLLELGLQSSGMDITSLDIYVFPVKDTKENPSPGNIAIAVLDSSNGFDLRNFGDDDITRYMESLASLGQEDEYDIERVVIAYNDEDGDSLIKMTAPTNSILDYADGKIPREQFLEELEGQFNLVEFAKKIAELAQ